MSRGNLHGAHRSRRVGSSPEFSEYRPYQQGDDPSRIDWRLFGRTERVAIRLAHDDSSLRTGVVLGASTSMAWPAESLDKWRTAAAVALGLSAVAFAEGDPVGLVIGGGAQPDVLPPSARRDTVERLRVRLVHAVPGGSTPLAPLLPALRSCRRIAIVSDFLGDAHALLERSRELVAQGREVHAVHVVAGEEIDPGPRGIVVDPEHPELRRTLEADHVASYRQRFEQWRGSLAASWRHAGASFDTALTSEGIDRIIRRVTAPAGIEAAR